MAWLKQSLTLFLFFALGSSALAQSQSIAASPTSVQITELERYGYRVNATEEELSQARQKIRAAANIPNGQSCGFDQEISGNRTIGHYDSVIQEMTPFMLQNFSQDCVEELLSQYKATKYQHRTYLIDSVPCRDSENTLQHRDQRCPLIVQYRNNFQIIQQRLKDALINPTEQNRVCSEESLETDLTTLQLSQQILAVLGEHEQNTECSELDVGQSDLRNNGLYNSYLLERKSPQEYQATLAIDLKRTEHSVTPHNVMFDKIKTCIEASSKYFKSPSGEVINVTIISPEEANLLPENNRPFPQTINYGTEFGTGNAGNYNEDFDCVTITHELLHSLGLLDEYHENGGGYYIHKETGDTIRQNHPMFETYRENGQLNYQAASNDCRSIAVQNPSILGEMEDAVDRMIGKTETCTCESENCSNILSSGNQNHLELLTFNFDGFKVTSDLCKFEALDPLVGTQNLTQEQLNSLPPQNIFEIQNINDTSYKLITRNLKHMTENNSLYAAALHTEVRVCSCTEESCRELFNHVKNYSHEDIKEFSCPRDFQKVEEPESFTYRFPEERIDSNSTLVRPDNRSIIIRRPPTHPTPNLSLLQPAQFTKLKFGNCQSRAEKYRECQRYGYVTSCPARPAFCDDESQWLLEQQ